MSGNPVLRKPFTLDVNRRAGSGQAADTARGELTPAEGASTRSVTIDDREDEPEQEITSDVSPGSDSHETAGTTGDDALQKIPDRYTVQVAARKSFSDAESLASSLKQLGYKAYIQRVQFPDTGEIWYRVRIGSYSSAAAARALKMKVKDLSLLRNQDVWVDYQRKNR
jgi:cell division septation protein DedD